MPNTLTEEEMQNFNVNIAHITKASFSEYNNGGTIYVTSNRNDEEFKIFNEDSCEEITISNANIADLKFAISAIEQSIERRTHD